MKEKRRPTMATGLESIVEEFKNLQTKDVINRFTTEIETKEGQKKFMVYLDSLNQGSEIRVKNTQADQIDLLEQHFENRNMSKEV